MSIEVLSTRGLPFSLMTTTHGLLLVADGECTDLFTYCPERGVMRGLGDFDDRMRMHTPKCLQLFRAPVEDDLRQMKREWERAARENTRSGKAARHVHHSPVKTEPTDDVGKPPSKRKVKERLVSVERTKRTLIAPHLFRKQVGASGAFSVRNLLSRFAMSFSCVLTAHAAWAEPVQLNAQAIRATLPGSVLKLDTPLRTVVPITFSADGYMSGDAGQLASVLGSQKDRGRWWVADDRVCYKWFRWFDAEQHCLAIKRDGQKVFWTQDSGETGTATLEEHGKPAPVQVAIARDSDRSAYIPRQKSATDLSYDTTNIRPPVLVKLPTLAVRPRKKTVVVLTTAVVPPMATSNGGRYTERDAQIP